MGEGNPPPSPGTIVATAGLTLEADRARLPYEAWFDPADPRVIRAASEAERVGAMAATWRTDGQSPDRWLTALGSALPGCGQPTCCRPGLFEVSLLGRGMDLRASRVGG